MTDKEKRDRLEGKQRVAVDRLVELFVDFVNRHDRTKSDPCEDKESTDVYQERCLQNEKGGISSRVKTDQEGADSVIHPEEDMGCFGLFGPRGSGKTTVLEHARNVLEDPRTCNSRIFVCWPPLDCTTLPADIALGIGLVSYLRKHIEQKLKGHHKGRRHEDTSAARQFEKSTAELLGKYLPLDRHYRELKLSLAVTSSEYSEIAQNELRYRQGVKVAVDEWITCTLRQLKGVQHILVVLEDVDLAVGLLSSRVLTTFLHDFSNSQIMFLVVADDDHLRLRFQREDDKRKGGINHLTKERLFEKLVPFQHRVHLESWQFESVRNFRPLRGGPQSVDSLEELLNRETGAGDSARNRRGLPNCEIDAEVNPIQVRDIVSLLPRYPRGLLDLYRRLKQGHPTSGGDSLKTTSRLTAEQLMILLARCRGESELVRKFPLRSVDWWAARLVASLENLSRTSWERIAFESRRSEPIWALEPGKSAPIDLSQGADETRWTELILNVACRRNRDFLSLIFIERFTPLTERLSFCRCDLRPAPRLLAQADSDLPLFLASPWLRWRVAENRTMHVEAGWSPLFKAWDLQYERDLFDLSRKLGTRISDELLVPHEERANILPTDVRSLVILVDNASRLLPWARIQEWAEDRVTMELLHVLAILCGNAYYQTLVDCDCTGKDVVAVSDFKDLARMSRETLLQECARLAREIKALDLSEADHPLIPATLAYFRGPWFPTPAEEMKGSTEPEP